MNDDSNIPASSFKKRKRALNLRENTSKDDDLDKNIDKSAVKIIRKNIPKINVVSTKEFSQPKSSKILVNISEDLSKSDLSNLKAKNEPENDSNDALKEVIKPHHVDYRFQNQTSIDRATKTADIDTEYDKDAQALFEKQMELNKELRSRKDDGLYKGQVAYAQYFEKQDSIKGKASSNLVRQGPYRASSNIRVTTRWDYQPDLCKDYKDTGFCGFGDSCKFVHDRTDYKAGWELERDYQAGLLNKDDTENYEIKEEEEEEVEYMCSICEKPFQNKVKAKCGHSFCEKCALDNFRKDSRCFVCRAETSGLFTHDKTQDNSKENIPQDSGKIINEIENASDTGESISDTPSEEE